MPVTTDFDEFTRLYYTPTNGATGGVADYTEYKKEHQDKFMKDFIYLWWDAGWACCWDHEDANDVTKNILEDRKEDVEEGYGNYLIYKK